VGLVVDSNVIQDHTMADGQVMLNESRKINSDFGGSTLSPYEERSDKYLHRVPEAPFARYTHTSFCR
jgi:hypothetical protein